MTNQVQDFQLSIFYKMLRLVMTQNGKVIT